MKFKHLVKYIIISFLVMMLMGISSFVNYRKSVREDLSLVVPGLGAESVLLGDKLGDVIRIFEGAEYRVARPVKKAELFNHVFKVDVSVKIEFDKIYYYDFRNVIVFFNNGRVSAIIGLRNNRVTPENVSFQKGIEYFVFSYGNKGMRKIKRSKNSIYLYKQKGIAIVDDDNDEDIDMFIVFKPVNNKN